jgi:superfamily I DNA and RNA helicase
VHKEDIRICRISCIFLTHAHPVELQSIQGVDISNNISDIMMSRERIPEIKMATATLKAVNLPKCYHDKKKDKKRNLLFL